jgi:hypothetical protein
MNRKIGLFVVFVVVNFALCGSAEVAPDTVMGNWEGKWYGESANEGKAFAQIIAEGHGNYRAVISADIGEAELIRGEMRGKRDDGKVMFQGEIDAGPDNGVHKITAAIADGKLTGHYSGPADQGQLQMTRVRKTSPTLGLKPPQAAIVLFDGKDRSKWQGKNQSPNPWRLVDGAMEVRGGSIETGQQFRDFKLHIEFSTPFEPEARGQARGNSGVYLPGNNEIQVLDSFALDPSSRDCGSFYGQAAPSVNACLPPGEWQTYDVTFIAPRFNDRDEPVKNASITVLHNGIKIHDNFHPKRPGVKEGPILLQDHGDKVLYRNIWLIPLRED